MHGGKLAGIEVIINFARASRAPEGPEYQPMAAQTSSRGNRTVSSVV
jgi:hypothetical protein